MSAKRAFMWLALLTVGLLLLTVVVHYIPIALPAAPPPLPTNGVVAPSSDTPTLTAGASVPFVTRAAAG